MNREEAPAPSPRTPGAEDSAPEAAPPPPGCPVIGLGASAGGLEAVRRFLGGLPAAPGAAFVVIQHLDPEHPSHMAELLAASCPMEVVQASDGMALAPDRVHVIPPNATLTVEGGVLRISPPGERRGLRTPVDQFFASLAADQQDRAVAIVLSGTGSDGTRGLRRVKEHAGMVMAEDPDRAEFDGMPRSAIATGAVDFVLPVEQMPETLLGYLRQSARTPVLPVDGSEAAVIDAILDTLRDETSHDFRFYKRSTVRRRIQRRMSIAGMPNIADYARVLRHQPREVAHLSRDLLVSITEFFREPEAWQALQDTGLPALIRRRGATEQLRVWVPGCATGEEAYTVAILLAETLERMGRPPGSFTVFATDVDKDALNRARTARYGAEIARSVSAERLERFFDCEGEGYRVKKHLKEQVVFAPQDLLQDPPFSNLDLISCRNLLIYIEPGHQKQILSLLHFALRDGGFLFLGSSESPGPAARLFRPEVERWRLYRRNDDARRSNLDVFPPVSTTRSARRGPLRASAAGGRTAGHAEVVQRMLLARFAPASVLVNAELRVLYYHGPLREYLEPAAGEPTDDLLPMLPEGLRSPLRHATRECLQTQRPATAEASVRRDDGWHPVQIDVHPVPERIDQDPLLLVSFHPDRARPVVPHSGEHHAEEVVQRLEEEVRALREELRTTVEQMGSANEELQASNEEIMSMNEELQSTNEELQASKEELQTLNDELEDTVAHLRETTDDLSNFLISTDIATVFLDAQMRVRRYTPATDQMLHLVPTDVGRPITDIAWQFEDPDLVTDARAVLSGGETTEKEIFSARARVFLRRVLPYQTGDGAGTDSGVVVTFTDITERREFEEAVRRSEETLRRVTDAVPVLISYVDRDGRYRFNNAAYERWFHRDPDSLRGSHLRDVVGERTYARLRPHMERALSGVRVTFDTELECHRGGLQDVQMDYIPDRDDAGAVRGFYSLTTDLSDRREHQRQVERLNRDLRLRLDDTRALFEAAPIGIFVAHDAVCSRMTMNTAGARMLRLPEDSDLSLDAGEMAHLPFRFHKDGRDLGFHELPMQRAAAENREVRDSEVELRYAWGERQTLLTYAAPLRDDDGQVRGCVGTFMDVTIRRETERQLHAALRRLDLHIENTPLGVLEWDIDFTITRWSRELERIFGWEAEEVLGCSLDELGFIHPEDRRPAQAVIDELLEGRADRNSAVNRNLRKDGSVVTCEWYNSVIRDPSGVPISVLSLALDISERKALETALREHANRLAEADQRKNEFLAMLGHELRNPLAPIRNSLEILSLRGDDAKTREWAHEVISRQAGHLTRLVDDLLDVARITRGLIRLERRPETLPAIIRQAAETVEETMRVHGHTLDLYLGADEVVVDGDATRLVQVFVNLLKNAARYTPEGGNIAVRLRQEGGRVTVDVEDDGIGIPESRLDDIFELFNRDVRGATADHTGLGLGLTLVRRLVAMHGGEVYARSPGEGGGSVFTVDLPVVTLAHTGSAEVREPGPVAATPARKAQRVLVVDDNEDVAASFTMLLQSMGYEVEAVNLGGDAAPAVGRFRPDVVLLDIGLPDMDGFAVARQLRGLAGGERLRIVAVTGYGRDMMSSDPDAPFDRQLVKPTQLEDLLDAIG